MYCPYCGAEEPESARFCPSCGRQQPAGAQQGQEEAFAFEPAPPLSPTALQQGYAGFWRRFVAICLDYFLAMFVVAVVSFLEGFILELLDASGTLIERIAGILGLVIPWLYFALFESSHRQATPGKMVMGAKVVTRKGQRIGFGRATLRYFAKYLSALLFMIGFIMAGLTPRKQALHDYIAGTLVRTGEQ